MVRRKEQSKWKEQKIKRMILILEEKIRGFLYVYIHADLSIAKKSR